MVAKFYASKESKSAGVKVLYGNSNKTIGDINYSHAILKLYGSVNGKTKLIGRFLKSAITDTKQDYPIYHLEAVPVYDEGCTAFEDGAEYDIYVRQKVTTPTKPASPTSGWFVCLRVEYDNYNHQVFFGASPNEANKAPEDFGDQPVARICFYFGPEPSLRVYPEIRIGNSLEDGSQIVLDSSSLTESVNVSMYRKSTYYQASLVTQVNAPRTLTVFYRPPNNTAAVPACVPDFVNTELVITKNTDQSEVWHKTVSVPTVKGGSSVFYEDIYPVDGTIVTESTTTKDYTATFYWPRVFPEGSRTISASLSLDTSYTYSGVSSNSFKSWQRDEVDYDFEQPVTEEFELIGTWNILHPVQFRITVEQLGSSYYKDVNGKLHTSGETNSLGQQGTWVVDGEVLNLPQPRNESKETQPSWVGTPFENYVVNFKEWINGKDGTVWNMGEDVVTEPLILVAIYERDDTTMPKPLPEETT